MKKIDYKEYFNEYEKLRIKRMSCFTGCILIKPNKEFKDRLEILWKLSK